MILNKIDKHKDNIIDTYTNINDIYIKQCVDECISQFLLQVSEIFKSYDLHIFIPFMTYQEIFLLLKSSNQISCITIIAELKNFIKHKDEKVKNIIHHKLLNVLFNNIDSNIHIIKRLNNIIDMFTYLNNKISSENDDYIHISPYNLSTYKINKELYKILEEYQILYINNHNHIQNKDYLVNIKNKVFNKEFYISADIYEEYKSPVEVYFQYNDDITDYQHIAQSKQELPNTIRMNNKQDIMLINHNYNYLNYIFIVDNISSHMYINTLNKYITKIYNSLMSIFNNTVLEKYIAASYSVNNIFYNISKQSLFKNILKILKDHPNKMNIILTIIANTYVSNYNINHEPTQAAYKSLLTIIENK